MKLSELIEALQVAKKQVDCNDPEVLLFDGESTFEIDTVMVHKECVGSTDTIPTITIEGT